MLFAGCTTMTWQHPSKNNNEYLADRFACIGSSAKAFPAELVSEQIAPGYTTPIQTECTKRDNGKNETISICTTSGGNYVPPRISTFDANENNRDKYFNACMEAAGWTYKETTKEK